MFMQTDRRDRRIESWNRSTTDKSKACLPARE
jgi:hypothetical protein